MYEQLHSCQETQNSGWRKDNMKTTKLDVQLNSTRLTQATVFHNFVINMKSPDKRKNEKKKQEKGKNKIEKRAKEPKTKDKRGENWGGVGGPLEGCVFFDVTYRAVCRRARAASNGGEHHDDAEMSRVGVFGDGTEGSCVGVFGDDAQGSRAGVFGDGTEGSPAVTKSIVEARSPFVLLAVERLLDMMHELALRCLERLRADGACRSFNFCHNVRIMHRFSSHRRTSTGYHVACVSSLKQNGQGKRKRRKKRKTEKEKKEKGKRKGKKERTERCKRERESERERERGEGEGKGREGGRAQRSDNLDKNWNLMWIMRTELICISFSIRIQTANALFFTCTVHGKYVSRRESERDREINKKKEKTSKGRETKNTKQEQRDERKEIERESWEKRKKRWERERESELQHYSKVDPRSDQTTTTNAPAKHKNSKQCSSDLLQCEWVASHHLPQQEQAQFIPSCAKHAQETPRQSCLYDASNSPNREWGQAHALWEPSPSRASQSSAYRELTKRVIIVIVFVDERQIREERERPDEMRDERRDKRKKWKIIFNSLTFIACRNCSCVSEHVHWQKMYWSLIRDHFWLQRWFWCWSRYKGPMEWSACVRREENGMRTAIGAVHEFASKTLGMVRRRASAIDTWSAQVQHDVHGLLGHQDGVQDQR